MSKKDTAETTTKAEKPVREDTALKHRSLAIAAARAAIANLTDSAESVIDGIEAGANVKDVFIAHKKEVDAYSKAINQLSLHAAPKPAKAKEAKEAKAKKD